MGLRRLRGRLDSLQSDTHFTLDFFRDLAQDLQEDATELIEAIRQRGIHIGVETAGDNSIMDFVTGKVKRLPIVITLELPEK